MLNRKGLNMVQLSGVLIAVVGLGFVAFPTTIGLLAIRIITLFVLLLGIIGFMFASMLKSKLTAFSSALFIGVGLYTFFNPDQALLFFGMTCIISGLNGMALNFKPTVPKAHRTWVSSVVLILLGVFAIINTKATLGTIVTILGLLLVIIGLVIIFIGDKFKTIQYNFHQTSYAHKSRVIIPIKTDDADDIDEVDYKEV